MTELLILVLVAAAYALGRAREERDRLLRLLRERADRGVKRPHWQPDAAQLRAEQLIWRQTAAVQRAAREAMRDVVAGVSQGARRPTPRPTPTARRDHRPAPSMPPAGHSAEAVQRATARTPR